MNKRVVAVVAGVAGGALLLGVGVGVGNASAGDIKESAEYQALQKQIGDHELHEEYLIQLESDLERREAAVKAREDAVAGCVQ